MNDYLEFAKRLAYRAGDIMLEHFQIGVPTDIKPDNTVVTVADTAINSLVIESVSTTYPDHAVIGEEESLHNAGAAYVWVCDPIDGTIPYALSIPTNVFSLALVDTSDGQPVVAVVFDPYLKRLYSAVKGQGAFVNDIPMHVSDRSEISEVFIGISNGNSKVANVADMQTAIMRACYRHIHLNCTIYEAMLVASGSIAAVVFAGPGAHDAVSSKLIVEEAGGKVTSVYGEQQRYDKQIEGALITNGVIHDSISKIIQPYLLH